MTGGVQQTQDQKIKQDLLTARDAIDKAKPVAVDPSAKQSVQSGQLTPKERLEGIAVLVMAAKNKQVTEDGRTATVQTARGEISIFVPKNETASIVISLVQKDAPSTQTVKRAYFSQDGKFEKLSDVVLTNDASGHKRKNKGDLTTEWAEKFSENLIRDALKGK
jgi:hypothetical protein